MIIRKKKKVLAHSNKNIEELQDDENSTSITNNRGKYKGEETLVKIHVYNPNKYKTAQTKDNNHQHISTKYWIKIAFAQEDQSISHSKISKDIQQNVMII